MPILRLMIRLFPAAFRAQFGAEMEAQIRLDYARAAETGFRSQALFFAGTLVDLLASGVAERWHPSWTINENPGRGRRGMGDGVREWVRDLRHASRSLRRSPGFTVVSVATLGLAIGATAGIFSVVDTVLLNPLPFPEPEELVYIGATAPGTELEGEFGVSAEFLVEYNEESQLLEGVAAYNTFTSSMRVGDRTERVWQSAPTVELFEVLGVQPILGRLPEAADEDRVVLLSHALWVTWFGSDPGVIGESIFVTGAMRTVIGVMPSTFHFPDDNILLWFPNPIRPANIIPGRFGMQIVGRLAPGATHEGLQEELTTLARRLPERFGGSPAYARVIAQHRPVIRSLEDQLLGNVSRPLWVLLGAVAIVLLIACSNVANLFVVRAERRQRDLAVRQAIGAGRAQLIRSQMSEAILIAVCACIVAVFLAALTIPILLRAAPPEIPRLGDVAVNAATILFSLAATAVTAILCGFIPALRASSPDLTRLRDAGRTTRRKNWARDGLVVGQTAMALVLLIGCGLLIEVIER
jgi:predicted permease